MSQTRVHNGALSAAERSSHVAMDAKNTLRGTHDTTHVAEDVRPTHVVATRDPLAAEDCEKEKPLTTKHHSHVTKAMRKFKHGANKRNSSAPQQKLKPETQTKTIHFKNRQNSFKFRTNGDPMSRECRIKIISCSFAKMTWIVLMRGTNQNENVNTNADDSL